MHSLRCTGRTAKNWAFLGDQSQGKKRESGDETRHFVPLKCNKTRKRHSPILISLSASTISVEFFELTSSISPESWGPCNRDGILFCL